MSSDMWKIVLVVSCLFYMIGAKGNQMLIRGRITALELQAEQSGSSAVKNTERLLSMTNGTCRAWECHEGER